MKYTSVATLTAFIFCTGCTNTARVTNEADSMTTIGFTVYYAQAKDAITRQAPVNIYLDGSYVGVVSEGLKLNVPKGTHTFKFTREQCADITQSIDAIGNGSHQSVGIVLQPAK